MERPIRYVRENFFYGRTFLNEEDLNAQASLWLKQVANVRIHGTPGERPIERFQREERMALSSLANRPYRSLVLSTVARPTARAMPSPVLQVERRPLEVYTRIAEAVPSSRREQIRWMLADLKMPAALEAADDILSKADSSSITAAEAIQELLGAQITLRNNRRLQAAMRSSRLPAVKTLEEFDFSFQPA